MTNTSRGPRDVPCRGGVPPSTAPLGLLPVDSCLMPGHPELALQEHHLSPVGGSAPEMASLAGAGPSRLGLTGGDACVAPEEALGEFVPAIEESSEVALT